MRRAFFALLALAVVSGFALFPADAADSGYQLAILSARTLTEGSNFDPDAAPDAANVNPGDIVVLTIGFRNDSGAAVSVSGFAVKLRYDKTKVSPYTGTAPFVRNPYRVSEELSGDYSWASAGNGAGDGFVSVAAGGSDEYQAPDGSALVLCRMAFRADADGVASFTLDSDVSKTNVTASNLKPLPLNAFRPFDLTIGEPYDVSAVKTDKSAGICKVTLSNPETVTVTAAFFDASGQFFAAESVSAPPRCGSVELPAPAALPDGATVKAALFDSDWRPLSCLDAAAA